MSLDLSILEIAADIIDETGRGTIAEQVRELKGKIERLVERIRDNEEQQRAIVEGYPLGVNKWIECARFFTNKN